MSPSFEMLPSLRFVRRERSLGVRPRSRIEKAVLRRLTCSGISEMAISKTAFAMSTPTTVLFSMGSSIELWFKPGLGTLMPAWASLVEESIPRLERARPTPTAVGSRHSMVDDRGWADGAWCRE